MSRHPIPQLAKSELDRLRTFRFLPNLTKIPLFIGLMVALGLVAWNTDSRLVLWAAYLGLGYMWMGMVTFMHDATHAHCSGVHCSTGYSASCACCRSSPPSLPSVKITSSTTVTTARRAIRMRSPWAAARGGFRRVLCLCADRRCAELPAFQFHLSVHAVRTATVGDPAAGNSAQGAAVLAGARLCRATRRAGQGAGGCGCGRCWCCRCSTRCASSPRHYGTPWNVGQLAGTRTVISNPVNSFFWNNINWHIGHHVYPSVPWYNLVELHRVLEPEILAAGARGGSQLYRRVLAGTAAGSGIPAAAGGESGRAHGAPGCRACPVSS